MLDETIAPLFVFAFYLCFLVRSIVFLGKSFVRMHGMFSDLQVPIMCICLCLFTSITL